MFFTILNSIALLHILLKNSLYKQNDVGALFLPVISAKEFCISVYLKVILPFPDHVPRHIDRNPCGGLLRFMPRPQMQNVGSNKEPLSSVKWPGSGFGARDGT